MFTYLILTVPLLLSLANMSLYAGADPTPDGTCGGENDYDCTIDFGKCCSSSGWCGDSTAHCGLGCQREFTLGNGCTNSTSSNSSPDGSCGGADAYVCHSAAGGKCCSAFGFCGDTIADYCGAGCQSNFSAPNSCSTGIHPSLDGQCGEDHGSTCTGGPFDGQCCSAAGFCGTTAAHCTLSAGCQPEFGEECE
ncbi:hypothetical protein DFH27DRAFT_177829 [Peziza echinospora]|nr:hypothetical protein DFH27DRAFT_177829 [Peziza echinospora]